MGTDLNFMVVSKDKDKLEQLQEYIHDLYSRGYAGDDDPRRMTGCTMYVEWCADYWLLCGEHCECSGYDLGYWCKREGKNDLLEDAIYLEEDQDDTFVYMYYPGDYLSTDGLLTHKEKLVDYTTAASVNQNHDFPDVLIAAVCNYFKHGDIHQGVKPIGTVNKGKRAAIVSYSKACIKMMLKQDNFGPYELSVFIIVLVQLMDAVCAPGCTVDKYGNYVVTTQIVQETLPKRWGNLAADLVHSRDTICNYYYSDECKEILVKHASNLSVVKEFAESLLAMS